ARLWRSSLVERGRRVREEPLHHSGGAGAANRTARLLGARAGTLAEAAERSLERATEGRFTHLVWLPVSLLTSLEQLFGQSKRNKWLRYFAVFCRIVLALGFIPSGIVK